MYILYNIYIYMYIIYTGVGDTRKDRTRPFRQAEEGG